MVGDALLELGRYREAFREFDTMVRLKPGVSSYARIAYARNGRCGEALRYSKLALRLGTRDAAKLFHRAEIERCLGRDPHPWARRALALNPRFSVLWAAALRRLAS